MAKPLGAIVLAVCPPQQRYPDSLARLGRIPTSAPGGAIRAAARAAFSCPGRQPNDRTTGPDDACLRICRHTSRFTFLSTN